jgi:hypothetical protein
MLLAIAIGSTILAVVMSVVAWRASSAERMRSAARVDALARAIDREGGRPAFDLTLRSSTRPQQAIGQPDVASAKAERLARSGAVLSSPQASDVGSRLGLSLAVGAFVVTAAAAAAIVFSSESPRASVNPASVARPAPEAPRPLELVLLDHERTGDTLVVHGVVRNPTGGEDLDQLTAVVSPVGLDGGMASSVRSPVDSPALAPGGQSTFSVTIPQAGRIGRYRVSFRAGDRIVSHVDKRIGS